MEENSSSKKWRREDLEEPEIYEALRRVVFQNEERKTRNRTLTVFRDCDEKVITS